MSQKLSSSTWILVAAGLMLAGCGTRSTVVSPAPKSPDGAPTTTIPVLASSTVAPAPSVTLTTTASSHHIQTTTATTRPVATTVAPVAGPSPAAPGTYSYRQVGSLPGTPAIGTLVVAPVSASGTQTWTRNVGGTVAPATTVMLFNTAGAYLVDPGTSAAGAQASCTFATPLAWPPWPTTVGASASGQAACSAPVSSYQVTVRVAGSAMLSLGGSTVDTAEVLGTIVIGGNYDGSPLNVTLTETDYYAAGLRVPVETVTHVVGHVLGLSVTTSRTDTLVSATPSS